MKMLIGLTACLLMPAAHADEAPLIEVDVAPEDTVTYSKNTSAADRKKKRQRIVVRRADDEPRQPAHRDALSIARELGLSDDDTRPEQQRKRRLLGKELILGGEVNTSARGRRHYDLTPGADDDAFDTSGTVKIEAIWLPTPTLAAFASARATGEAGLHRQGGNARAEAGLALDNAWLLKTGLFGTDFALQIGRQRVRDKREWWWDDNLDAVRLHYFGSKVTAFAGIGKPLGHYATLGRLAPEERGQMRAFGNIAWEWRDRQHMELFALRQADQTRRALVGDIIPRSRADRRDPRLSWVGARVRGCAKPGLIRRLCYWGDLAQVRGAEQVYDLDGLNSVSLIVDQAERRRVKGWAYDAGLNLELPFKPRPVITIGHARGSGDRPGTPGRDGAFRQTGLHRNDGKFRGNSRFRYYGEVLRPDLANISISTLGLGLPVSKHGWLETVWHRYRQVHADNQLSGSPIGRNPNGDDPRLGEEVNIIASYRPPSGWEFELTAGAFRAGPAFGADLGRWASLVEVRVDYNF